MILSNAWRFDRLSKVVRTVLSRLGRAWIFVHGGCEKPKDSLKGSVLCMKPASHRWRSGVPLVRALDAPPALFLTLLSSKREFLPHQYVLEAITLTIVNLPGVDSRLNELTVSADEKRGRKWQGKEQVCAGDSTSYSTSLHRIY